MAGFQKKSIFAWNWIILVHNNFTSYNNAAFATVNSIRSVFSRYGMYGLILCDDMLCWKRMLETKLCNRNDREMCVSRWWPVEFGKDLKIETWNREHTRNATLFQLAMGWEKKHDHRSHRNIAQKGTGWKSPSIVARKTEVDARKRASNFDLIMKFGEHSSETKESADTRSSIEPSNAGSRLRTHPLNAP